MAESINVYKTLLEESEGKATG